MDGFEEDHNSCGSYRTVLRRRPRSAEGGGGGGKEGAFKRDCDQDWK